MDGSQATPRVASKGQSETTQAAARTAATPDKLQYAPSTKG